MAFTVIPLKFSHTDRGLAVERTLRTTGRDGFAAIADMIREVERGRGFLLGSVRGCGKTSLLNEVSFHFNRQVGNVVALGPLSLGLVAQNGLNSLGSQLSDWFRDNETRLPYTLPSSYQPTHADSLDAWLPFLNRLINQHNADTLLLLLDDLDSVPLEDREAILQGIQDSSWAKIATRTMLGCAGNLLEDEISLIPGDEPYASGRTGSQDAVVAVILKRETAVDLLNTLIVGLGTVPGGMGKEGGGGGGYPYGGMPPDRAEAGEEVDGTVYAEPPMSPPAPSPAAAPAAEGGGLLGGEGPEPPVAAPSPPKPKPKPEPEEARFLNAGLAGHPKDEPLEVGETYVLEFGVDVKPSGDASAVIRMPDASVLFAEDEQIIELTVQVSSDDFDVAQGPTALKLPRRGPSKGKARFDITPKKKGRGKLTATIHKQGNFLMQMEISYSVGKVAAKAASTVAHGRTITGAAGLKPRELTMVIRPVADGYDCTVIGHVHKSVVLPITEAYVADAIREVRDAMMTVITQRDDARRLVFQIGHDIDPASEKKALRTLALAGASLFQHIFFGPAAGAEVHEVGELLRELATQPDGRPTLQIVQVRFPIPWGLIYVGDVAGNASLDWDLFLGMRHVIETIPLQPKMTNKNTVIRSDDPSLSVSVNVNVGIDEQMQAPLVARQLDFWNDRAAAFGGRMELAERRSRADLLAALGGTAGDQLMYFYCHAVTSKPGDPINDSHLVLTGKEVLTLGELNREAPMTKTLRGNPLIFINACESAELTPAFYDGFVPYFMTKGARGVIGTECKTPARFGTEWALRFFPRFLAGEPLGELFLDLRREFSRDHHNPLGLVYAVYCDGDTQVQPGLT